MLEEFINNKAKAFVIFLFSLISLGVFVISTQFSVLVFSGWNGIIGGITLMILSIPLHIIGKKFHIFYMFSFLLNSLANGFSVSAYYLMKNISVNLFEMIIAAVPAAAILFLVYTILQIFLKTKRFSLSIATGIIILLMITAVYFWKTYAVYSSFAFFNLLISLFFICVFGISVNHNERFVLRDISFGSFGSFIILTIVVIVILSEGELLDGFDLDLGGGKGKKKK